MSRAAYFRAVNELERVLLGDRKWSAGAATVRPSRPGH